MTLDEVFDEYKDIPISEKHALADQYAEALRKTGEMTEEEIENEVSFWEIYDERAELRRMYGTDIDEELDDLMESNSFWGD